jgi:prolyl-tRNA synthetase
MMQDGKSLQGATSHDLGQNFGRAFDITFQNKEGVREHVWQTSWGCTTRTIGALIMVHSDDGGLVLPPRVAPIHVAIVPIWKTDARRRSARSRRQARAELRDDGLVVKVDDRDALRPGEKYYHWERKGVPLRLEVGPRDVASASAMAKTRIGDPKAKEKVPFEGIGVAVGKLLDQMQKDAVRARARLPRSQHT